MTLTGLLALIALTPATASAHSRTEPRSCVAHRLAHCREDTRHHVAVTSRHVKHKRIGSKTTTTLRTSTPEGASPTTATGTASPPSVAGITVPSPTTTSSTSIPAPSVGAATSAWDEPTLVDPTTIVLTAANGTLLTLDDATDYIIDVPAGVDSIPGGAVIVGGHNVVINGGDINDPDYGPVGDSRRALYLKDQTGTVWIHDVHLSGPDLDEGIDLYEPNATVVLRNILEDEVYGSATTWHADLIQTWGGPKRLLVDGFVGSTSYQGFFLLPNQDYSGLAPTQFDLRNVYINDTQGAYALWRAAGDPFPLNVSNVYVTPNPQHTWVGWWQWPQPNTGDTSWANAIDGQPLVPFVTATSYGATGISDTETPAPLSTEGTEVTADSQLVARHRG
jgi:hypothetical protein